MEMKIRTFLPSDPEAVSVIRAYVRIYGKKGTPVPLIEELKRKHPEWREYFARHPESDLQHADVNEVNSCLELILEYRKRSH